MAQSDSEVKPRNASVPLVSFACRLEAGWLNSRFLEHQELLVGQQVGSVLLERKASFRAQPKNLVFRNLDLLRWPLGQVAVLEVDQNKPCSTVHFRVNCLQPFQLLANMEQYITPFSWFRSTDSASMGQDNWRAGDVSPLIVRAECTPGRLDNSRWVNFANNLGHQSVEDIIC